MTKKVEIGSDLAAKTEAGFMQGRVPGTFEETVFSWIPLVFDPFFTETQYFSYCLRLVESAVTNI